MDQFIGPTPASEIGPRHAEPDLLGDQPSQAFRATNGREWNHPGRPARPHRDFTGDRRLPHPTEADEVDGPPPFEQFQDIGDLVFAADDDRSAWRQR